MSLRGGSLRLMMATFIYMQPEQMGFWASFHVAELVGLLTSQTKGGDPMITDIFHNVVSSCTLVAKKFLSSAGLNRGSRFNLLTSQWNSGENQLKRGKITSKDALLLLKVSEHESISIPIRVLKSLGSTWTLGLLNEKRTFNHIHLEKGWCLP